MIDVYSVKVVHNHVLNVLLVGLTLLNANVLKIQLKSMEFVNRNNNLILYVQLEPTS